MKKIITTIITAITVMTLAVASVFAAGSTTGLVEISGCTDPNGVVLGYSVTDTTIPLLTVEIASELNSAPASELRLLWQRDISADSVPATFTFNANGTDGQTLYVYHWNGSAWELMNSGIGPSITTTFTSLSPVSLVVRVPSDAPASGSSSAGTSSETTSPRTGSDYTVLASLACIVVAGSAAYVVATKKS